MSTENKSQLEMKSDFLLVEYQRLQQLHFSEKKDENDRVNFFILATSGAIAGVILLYQNDNIIIIEILLMLFIIIGLNTLGRIAMAHSTSMTIMELKKQIRTEFSTNTQIQDFINAREEIISKHLEKSGGSLRKYTILKFLVITINTFLINGFIFIPLIPYAKNLCHCYWLTSILIILCTGLLTSIVLSKCYDILKKILPPWRSSL